MIGSGSALVFGGGGQDGFYLKKLLELEGVTVVTVSRHQTELSGDVGDQSFVESCIKTYAPDYIFQLAATSSARHEGARDNHDAIATGTMNILEHARRIVPGARIFVAGSALQFENSGVPISETTPFEARSAYAASRVYATYLSRYYRHAFGMRVFVGYLFNHESFLRSEQFLSGRIARTVARIKAGSPEKLILGGLNMRKEYGYAGDVVRAIWILLNQDSVHEAVIGTSVSHTLGDWASCCFAAVGLRWRDHVEEKSDFIPEYATLVSDSRLMQSLGWRPSTGITRLAEKMVLNEP